MRRVVLYNHGGSANHGCEAIVRSVCTLLDNRQITLMSDSPEEDMAYGVHKIAAIIPSKDERRFISLASMDAYLRLKLKHDYFPMDIVKYRRQILSLTNKNIAVSIGGDNYCYDNYPMYVGIHRLAAKRCRTVLLGCSINEGLFSDRKVLDDLRSYNLIIARESLTEKLLKDTGIDNVHCVPDPAFILPTEDVSLPWIMTAQTVGINVSPLVIREGGEIVYLNYLNLIKYILEKTDMYVVLIPHVVWNDNDDREVLKKLFQDIARPDRVIMIPDQNCMELKGYISRCTYFVGARTHATIAAYSSCVPTLAVGYSIKARGIARDLFGEKCNYVYDVKNMKSKFDLTESFQCLMDEGNSIRRSMEQLMPQYKNRVWKVRSLLLTMMQETENLH